MDYFKHIVGRLSLDDVKILGILYEKDATATFKAMKKQEISKTLNITEANYRKSLNRLDVTNFIEKVSGTKEHRIYINQLGIQAFQLLSEGDY